MYHVLMCLIHPQHEEHRRRLFGCFQVSDIRPTQMARSGLLAAHYFLAYFSNIHFCIFLFWFDSFLALFFSSRGRKLLRTYQGKDRGPSVLLDISSVRFSGHSVLLDSCFRCRHFTPGVGR